MSGSATYTRRVESGAPTWGAGIAGILASDESAGTRALVAGQRWAVAGGMWVRSGCEPVASIDAAGYGDGAVLQVTAGPRVASVPDKPSQPWRRKREEASE